jgi:hypothetical protein
MKLDFRRSQAVGERSSSRSIFVIICATGVYQTHELDQWQAVAFSIAQFSALCREQRGDSFPLHAGFSALQKARSACHTYGTPRSRRHHFYFGVLVGRTLVWRKGVLTACRAMRNVRPTDSTTLNFEPRHISKLSQPQHAEASIVISHC